ncbi:glutamine synthetase family protein [Streptomonospora sediminis]
MVTRSWSRPQAESSVGQSAYISRFGLWNDGQCAAAERIEGELDGVGLVRLVFADPHGLARSKTLTADAFRRVLRNGMDFSPGPFLFDTGHAIAVDFLGADSGMIVGEIAGAGDFIVVPDPLTFQVLPADGTRADAPRTAWVIGDEYLRDGTPHPLSSRAVLRRVCRDYADRGLVPVAGLEVEWHLTRLLGGPAGNAGNGFGLQGEAPRVGAVDSGYQFNLDGLYDAVAPVTDPLAMALIELGLPLRSMEHESGPGQIETTFDPMSALDAADAMLLFRTFTKQVCARRGYHASFMALPRLNGFDPSGWHVHQSVAAAGTGRNVFAAEPGAEAAEQRDYVGGLLARAVDLCLLSVPTINGYRRFAPGYALSPTHVGCSHEDRSALVRVLGAGSSTHVENRAAEPCANPYLALAAQFGAGLSGMAGMAGAAGPGGAEQNAAVSGSLPGDPLPEGLAAALDAFRSSDQARRLLGAPLQACLARLKESEISRYEAWCKDEQPTGDPAGEVTEWEQREYFAAY